MKTDKGDNMKEILSPSEIAEFTVEVGVNKANMKWWKQFILGIMAGLFISLAGNAASVAGYGVSGVGTGKMVSGALFGTGLIMVLLAGAELFTGNCLVSMAVLQRKVKAVSMLRNWILVYMGNLAGGVLYTFLMGQTTQMSMDGGAMGAYAINSAYSKCTMNFIPAFVMGIFCNLLVCIAVWVSYSSKNVVGKIAAMYFPIWIFVTSGYEHCVANMYYIPMGIFAKLNDTAVDAAYTIYGLDADKLSQVNWSNFFITNLIPVTLGNIVGGVILVGAVYWLVYLKKDKKVEDDIKTN